VKIFVWNGVFRWLGICFVNSVDIEEHALQFCGA